MVRIYTYLGKADFNTSFTAYVMAYDLNKINLKYLFFIFTGSTNR